MFGFSGLKVGILAIVGAVLVAAVGGFMLYVRHLSSENAKLTANNAVLTTTLEAEKAAREAIALAREQDARISAEAIQATAARAARANVIKQEIIHAPPVAAGCPAVGPAVGIVLDRVRNAAGDRQAGSAEAEAAGKPAPVRPGTAGP